MNHRAAAFLALLEERAFPRDCASCGTLLLGGEEAFYGLCGACFSRFAVDPEARCRSCGRPLISEQEVCIPCREGEGFDFDRAFSLYPYRGPYEKLLKAWKFGKNLPLGNFFTVKLEEAARNFAPDAVWVPVPPRPGKIRSLGWDQVGHLAECLRRRGGKVWPCLKRLPSRSQKELDRTGRRENLRGRIIAVKPPPRRALLFDDVITTGSTLDACAGALKEAGAEEVFALSLFTT
jgi:ComF family protein